MGEPNLPAKLREIAGFMVPVFGDDNPAVCYLRESAGEIERLHAMAARLNGCDLQLKTLRPKLADCEDALRKAWAMADAAPDLMATLVRARAFAVEALRDLVDLEGYDPARHVIVAEIDAAIAKATGAKP